MDRLRATERRRRARITVVAPAWDEEGGIAAFVHELFAVLDPLPYDSEVLIVNDGSRDATGDVLEDLCREYPRLGVVHLSRNFGHQAALTAGLDLAEGDAIITMDSDREHPPALIPELLRQWEAGYDVVYGVRRTNRELSFLKRLTSRLYYRIINRISETPIPANVADFRLLSRRAADEMRRLRERTRFLRGLSSWIGFRQIGVPYDSPTREHGATKYTLRRMLNLGAAGIITMSTMPLRASLLLGFTISGASLGYMLWVVVTWFLGDKGVAGWPSLIVAILFLGGLQLSMTGIIGLYVANIYAEVKGRPIYIVRRRSGTLREFSPDPRAEERETADAAPH